MQQNLIKQILMKMEVYYHICFIILNIFLARGLSPHLIQTCDCANIIAYYHVSFYTANIRRNNGLGKTKSLFLRLIVIIGTVVTDLGVPDTGFHKRLPSNKSTGQ